MLGRARTAGGPAALTETHHPSSNRRRFVPLSLWKKQLQSLREELHCVVKPKGSSLTFGPGTQILKPPPYSR